MHTAAANYASTIAGDPLLGQEVHDAVPPAPAGTVDEDRLVDKLIREAAYAQREGGACQHWLTRIYPAHLTRLGIVAEKAADAAHKMEAAKTQDDRWVQSHAGEDLRAKEAMAQGLGRMP